MGTEKSFSVNLGFIRRVVSAPLGENFFAFFVPLSLF
jgi:hypothetical protein